MHLIEITYVSEVNSYVFFERTYVSDLNSCRFRRWPSATFFLRSLLVGVLCETPRLAHGAVGIPNFAIRVAKFHIRIW